MKIGKATKKKRCQPSNETDNRRLAESQGYLWKLRKQREKKGEMRRIIRERKIREREIDK